jgi:GNAT superfamily N-acetyltransferase
MAVAQSAQKVHSKLQIRAVPSSASSLLHRSQVVLISNIPGILPGFTVLNPVMASNRGTAPAPSETFDADLDDGTRIHFRPIRPDDKTRLAAGLKHLSDESRYLRFFQHLDHFSDAQLRYLTEVDFTDHFAWMATMPDRPGDPGAGVGRWIRVPDDPTIAEGAVTVVDELHHRGIGSTLLWLMARSAIQHGVRAFRAWTLGENRAVLDLLHQLGARRGRWDGGVLEVIVPLPADVRDLEATAAPLVLKATAAGVIQAEADPQRPAGTRLRPPEE